MRILMVCLGNICRSPLAEGIMRHKIEAHGLSWTVDSAGTGSWHIGNAPDPRSIAVAGQHGLDISAQRAMQFKAHHFSKFDLIFAMDSSNYQNIMRLGDGEADAAKVAMILNMSNPGMNQGVPDPYWNDDGFEQVYQMLDAACDAVIEKYK